MATAAVVCIPQQVRFIERNNFSLGRHWEVRRGFSAIGYVRQNPLTQRFEYFKDCFVGTCAYRAPSLNVLKNRLTLLHGHCVISDSSVA